MLELVELLSSQKTDLLSQRGM